MKNDYKKILDEILNKKFSKNLVAGYDPLEVDMFFDKIRIFIVKESQRYSELEKLIELKDQKINSLKSELLKKEEHNKMLSNEIISYKNDGYESQKMIHEISTLRKEMESLKKDVKK